MTRVSEAHALTSNTISLNSILLTSQRQPACCTLTNDLHTPSAAALANSSFPVHHKLTSHNTKMLSKHQHSSRSPCQARGSGGVTSSRGLAPSVLRAQAAATEPDKAQPDWTGNTACLLLLVCCDRCSQQCRHSSVARVRFALVTTWVADSPLTLGSLHTTNSTTGESVLSRVVNWMIETKPIYSVMKLGAMNAMKSTTQKAGIDWDGHVRRMAATPEVCVCGWMCMCVCGGEGRRAQQSTAWVCAAAGASGIVLSAAGGCRTHACSLRLD